MRYEVKLNNPSKTTIPFDYQYLLSSALYRKLSEADAKFADEVHSSTEFKFYNFSNLNFQQKQTLQDGFRSSEMTFILSSPDLRFIQTFAEGLLSKPEMTLGKTKLQVESITLLEEPIVGKAANLRTLSPIYVKTQRETDGKLVEWDLYPKEGKFYENLHANLIERFKQFHGRDPAPDYFEVTSLHSFKPRRVRIEDSYRRCSLMEFELAASEELIRFAHDAGLGEKTAMGFGCIELY